MSSIFFFVLFLFHVFTRLKHLDDMLSSACLSAEAVYKVLYWDDHVKSSRSASSLPLHTHTHAHTYKVIFFSVEAICMLLLTYQPVRWHLQYFAPGSLEGCYYWFACFMLLLWAGCLLDSTALSSCGTETSAEVRTSSLEAALANSLELFRTSVNWRMGVLSVLMDLRNVFHVGPSQASETVCEEQEQSNLLDSTPTPTSLEVRGGYIILIAEAFIQGSKEWPFICFEGLSGW